MPPAQHPKKRSYHDRGRGKPRHGGPRPWERPSADDGPIRLFGFHAVQAALSNPAREIGRVVLTENGEKRLDAELKARGVTPERVAPHELDRLLGSDTVHQGIMLETAELPDVSLDELAEKARRGAPIVVLDQVTDPHNVGAILRSAAALGAAGLVLTKRHSPRLDGALAKAASGALELVPVALVTNLARALDDLMELNIRVLGLDGEAALSLEDASGLEGVALVLGAEGKGLRHLTREKCDQLVSIATGPALSSLNVSNAAAIALHLALLGRKKKATSPG